MKIVSIAVLFLTLSLSSAFANPPAPGATREPVRCFNVAERAGLAAVNKKWPGASVETRTVTGHRLLVNGDFIETYLIGISDETDPSDWVVIINKKNCSVKFVDDSTDGASEWKYRG